MRFNVLPILVLGTSSALATPWTSKYPTLAQVKQKFYSEGIVPDVLPSFNPTALLYLTYTGNLSDGSNAKVVVPGTSLARNGKPMGLCSTNQSHLLLNNLQIH